MNLNKITIDVLKDWCDERLRYLEESFNCDTEEQHEQFKELLTELNEVEKTINLKLTTEEQIKESWNFSINNKTF